MVYKVHFSTSTFTYPKIEDPLLLTCRLVYKEALPLYYGNATLCFLSLENLMDYTQTIPPSIISSLRHLHVYTTKMFIKHGLKSIMCDEVSLSELIETIPGLALDRLTVEVSDMDRFPCEMETMIESRGYKELTIRSSVPEDHFLTKKLATSMMKCHAFVSVMSEEESGASFHWWQCISDQWEMVWDENLSKNCQASEPDGVPHIMEVRVKRGRDADYVETGKMFQQSHKRTLTEKQVRSRMRYSTNAKPCHGKTSKQRIYSNALLAVFKSNHQNTKNLGYGLQLMVMN